ncbi:GntR family transcriptional regulator [Novosphingobium kaempferiae]|uniref:GntR family transcriptional regulator n=1 Tax=Novosphingobium kaempferiae TaxID=2896849 RepID=UPI001E3B41FE|nr:GntR family transcriptional regulator [Novosphingobium kaempferiae]
MAPEPVAAERAYKLLKSDLLAGRFKPGSPIIERQIALEYGMSISPLRDAAHRLVGERMVEMVKAGGYRVPYFTATALRDLYVWHGQLVRLVLKDFSQSDPVMAMPDLAIGPGQPVAAAATAVFRSLADFAQNKEHGRALASANDRLTPTRIFEDEALIQIDEELASVANAIFGSSPDRLSLLRAYHRRRIRRAGKIAMIANQGGSL